MKKKACRGKPAAALLAAFVLCIAVSAGCGRDDSQQKHYYMMEVEVQEYPRPEGWKTGWLPLGRQFYGGEAVRLWSESKPKDGGMTVDIYLSHEDGSSELLYQDMPQEFRRGTGWLNRSGNLYFRNSEELAGLDGEGNVLFRTKIKISDICQSTDGRIWLLLPPGSGGMYSKLAEMDAKTGAVTEKNVGLKNVYGSISADEDGLLLLNSDGIRRLNLNDGSTAMIMNFTTLSYRLESASSFRLSKEGGAEILKSDARETLRTADVSELRKVVVFRDWDIDYKLKDHIFDFNRSNEEYYVALEEGGDGEDISDFRMRTGIELAAGRGADIISSSAVPDVMGYIRKGTLEDLTPYLENSGMRKEDFFPAAFEHWEYDGKIYGVEFNITPAFMWIDEEVLGDREVPDVETLVEVMLDYQGEKKWFWPSDWILDYLLRGSEDLWGMIDWEKGSCDFTGKLFLDMLKAAKMHGGSFAKENVSTGRSWAGYAKFDSDEKMAAEGRVKMGLFFDDGSHAFIPGADTMAVSSSSRNKEGAWAFICYLLDSDIQNTNLSFVPLANGSWYPVSREAFDELGSFMESKVNTVSGYSVQEKKDIVDPKRHEEIRAVLEDARFAPISIRPILDIILEEADWYFNDVKSAEEVCGVIQNRVKLYLEENR